MVKGISLAMQGWPMYQFETIHLHTLGCDVVEPIRINFNVHTRTGRLFRPFCRWNIDRS